MNFRQFVPRFISSRLSFETKLGIVRWLEDLLPSAAFVLSPSSRRQAAQHLITCQKLPDLFDFARTWLGVGPVQIPEKIEGLLTYLSLANPRTVCEIGTESGGTSLLLSRGLPSVDLLVCVDLFAKNMPRLRRFVLPSQAVRFVNGPSAAPAAVRQVSRALASRSLDVLFIDGDHRYEGVRKDFLAYRHFVRPAGIIVFHDIVPDHRARYGIETIRWTGGVPQFWEQLKQHYPHREFIQNPSQNGFGIGALQYDPSVDPVVALGLSTPIAPRPAGGSPTAG